MKTKNDYPDGSIHSGMGTVLDSDGSVWRFCGVAGRN